MSTGRQCDATHAYNGGVQCELDVHERGMHRFGVATHPAVYWLGDEPVQTRTELMQELAALRDLGATFGDDQKEPYERGMNRAEEAGATANARLARRALVLLETLVPATVRYDETVLRTPDVRVNGEAPQRAYCPVYDCATPATHKLGGPRVYRNPP